MLIPPRSPDPPPADYPRPAPARRAPQPLAAGSGGTPVEDGPEILGGVARLVEVTRADREGPVGPLPLEGRFGSSRHPRDRARDALYPLHQGGDEERRRYADEEMHMVLDAPDG